MVPPRGERDVITCGSLAVREFVGVAVKIAASLVLFRLPNALCMYIRSVTIYRITLFRRAHDFNALTLPDWSFSYGAMLVSF